MYECGWLSRVEERGRARRRERRGETMLSYDERLDWLESDDCSKWPGRWLHLCFPFSPSLIPSSLPHLLSQFHLSLPLCLSLPHPLPGFIMATHQESAPLSPNGTAISTNAFPTYSSCHITIWIKGHVFLQSPRSPCCLSSSLVSRFWCAALHDNLSSAVWQWSSSVAHIWQETSGWQ